MAEKYIGDLFDTAAKEKAERKKVQNNAALSVLNMAKHHFDNMYSLKKEGERCHAYVAGRQWEDKIKYFDSHGRPCYISEMDALLKQGYQPRTTNLLNRVVRNVMGVVLKNGNEPTAYSQDGEEQAACDVINVLVQTNNTRNKTKLLWPLQFKQFLEWGMICAKVTYGYNNEGKFDSWTENIDPRNFFCDTGMMDVRGWDGNMVGMIHTLDLDDILTSFATGRNAKEAHAKHKKICEIYSKCADRKYVSGTYAENFGKMQLKNVDFLFPKDGDKCRLIEVWTRERRDRFYVHDTLSGTIDIIKPEDYELYVEKENQMRIAAAIEAGADPLDIIKAKMCAEDPEKADELKYSMPESCRLCVPEYREERYWYYRFMAPTGDVLDEGETPYMHKGHPFVFVFYPFINGEIRSYVADLLEEQKNLNRNLTMYDQIMRISMKGFTVYDKNSLPSNDPDGELLHEQLAQPGGSYGLELKAGEQIQNKMVQLSSNNTGIGLLERIQQQQTNIEDIGSVNGALQGKAGYSTTSGSLYQQQQQNATGALLDVIEPFYSFLIDCAYKTASNILNCYNQNMVTKIAGTGAWETLQQYMATLNTDSVELDFRMLESSSSAIYRQVVWDYAQGWLQMGFIDFNTYLKICQLPVTQKLMVWLEQKNQELMEQGQQPLPDRMPQQGGQTEAALAGVNAANAGGGMNAYNRMAQTKPTDS